MSNTGFKVRFDENGDIVDILGGGCLKSTPEEKVRQRFIETLINEYHYPANTIRREVPIQHGSKELRDKDGNPVRADIVVYASKAEGGGRIRPAGLVHLQHQRQWWRLDEW